MQQFVFRSIHLAIAVMVLALATGSGHAQFDAGVDFDGNGQIDFRDLFESGERWQSGQADATNEDTLFQLNRSWHTTGAAATPTPGAGRTLSIEQNVPVELTELFPGSGVFSGQMEVLVELSDISGVASISVTLPFLFQDGNEDYTVSLIEATATGPFSGFGDVDIQPNQSGGQVLTLSSDTAVGGSGPGDVMTLRFNVIANVMAPLPEDALVPIPIQDSEVLDASDNPLGHTPQDGSLLINPSGTFVTPTPTVGGPTPTPTPTATPGGVAESLLVTVCEPDALAGEDVNVIVDLLDGQGRIVNPGTPGGAGPVDVTLTVSGSGQFSNGSNQTTETLEDGFGLTVEFSDAVPETVTVGATAPGLVAADPVMITILPSGAISGTVTVDGRPATASEATIVIIDRDTGLTVNSTVPQVFTGNYMSDPLEPGNYDVSFEPGFGTIPLGGECATNVSVQAGQTTTGIDADLMERTGGVMVSGSVSSHDGSNLTNVTVTLTPTGVTRCGNSPLTTSTFQGAGAASLDYQFTRVPAGTYEVDVTAAGTDPLSGFFTFLDDVTITVGGSNVTRDLMVAPTVRINPTTPVNFQRVSGNFNLEWQAPSAPGTFTYNVIVANRCEGIVWQQSGVTGTSIPYGGPALNPANFYFWTVSGTNDTNTAFAGGQFGGLAIPVFLAD